MQQIKKSLLLATHTPKYHRDNNICTAVHQLATQLPQPYVADCTVKEAKQKMVWRHGWGKSMLAIA